MGTMLNSTIQPLIWRCVTDARSAPKQHGEVNISPRPDLLYYECAFRSYTMLKVLRNRQMGKYVREFEFVDVNMSDNEVQSPPRHLEMLKILRVELKEERGEDVCCRGCFQQERYVMNVF